MGSYVSVCRVTGELGVPSVILVNAEIYPNTPFLDLSQEDWDRVIDTNRKWLADQS